MGNSVKDVGMFNQISINIQLCCCTLAPSGYQHAVQIRRPNYQDFRLVLSLFLICEQSVQQNIILIELLHTSRGLVRDSSITHLMY